MGNVADQLFVFPVKFYLFLGIGFQAQPHLLKIPAELSELIIRLRRDLKVQVAVLDILSSLLQLCQRHGDRPVDPVHQNRGREKDNDQNNRP